MTDRDPLTAARRSYAEELRFTAHVRSAALLSAFASVPRERFVGVGPWHVRSPMGEADYWITDDADPRSLYHDVLVALDAARGINNGQPSLWAFLLDQLHFAPGGTLLHLGCGAGYYTAIMTELLGPEGRITAIEIDETLAERARVALAPWPNVTVLRADGVSALREPADIIVASAGATHPPASWLDALQSNGGQLLFPMTSDEGPGMMLLVTRGSESSFAARFLCCVGAIDFQGARDGNLSERLAEGLRRDDGGAVRSLRRDQHPEDASCWLHGADWCLSQQSPETDG